uniref:Uncharacterized protein n=2 Tax=Meloidogyne TaxID=189290 RepID=A0A6V7UHP7_MELEN|nr:unnamed protein product [Meloidogyne enterolobii]
MDKVSTKFNSLNIGNNTKINWKRLNYGATDYPGKQGKMDLEPRKLKKSNPNKRVDWKSSLEKSIFYLKETEVVN